MGQLQEWNQRLARLAGISRRKKDAMNNQWARKLISLKSCWNIWHYQIIGKPPTQYVLPRKYVTWEARLVRINQVWQRKLKYSGWTKRFDCLRRTWADTGKQIQGGMGHMDKDMKNERIQVKDLRAMLMKQNYRCAITGRELTPENCSVDHIIPLSREGVHSMENAQLVVSEVNHAKGNLTEEEFFQLCADALAYRTKKK